MKKNFYHFQVAKINFLVTFKSHFKKIDEFQSSKLKFLVTFNTQNKILIVEFLVIWAHCERRQQANKQED